MGADRATLSSTCSTEAARRLCQQAPPTYTAPHCKAAGAPLWALSLLTVGTGIPQDGRLVAVGPRHVPGDVSSVAKDGNCRALNDGPEGVRRGSGTRGASERCVVERRRLERGGAADGSGERWAEDDG